MTNGTTHTQAAEETSAEWYHAWTAALTALEIDVLEAERLLAAGHAATEVPAAPAIWTPPVLPGPLPGSLRTRAEAILARQLRVADDLVRTMGSTRREMLVARKMDSGAADRTRPAFVDSQM